MSDIIRSSASQLDAALKSGSLCGSSASVEECEKAANDLFVLKKALEAARLYKKKRKEYQLLEAQTIVDICKNCTRIVTDESGNKSVEVDGDFNDKKVFEAVKYLAVFDDEKLQSFVEECRTGDCSIYRIINSIKDKEADARAIDRINNHADLLVDCFKKFGHVSIDELRSKRKNIEKVCDATRDRVRDRITKAGGIAVSENEYVHPSIATEAEVKRVIKRRLESLSDDIGSLMKLMSYTTFDSNDELFRSYTPVMALHAYSTTRAHRDKDIYENEFLRMAQRAGKYDYHCPASVKRLSEEFDDIAASEDGLEIAKAFGFSGSGCYARYPKTLREWLMKGAEALNEKYRINEEAAGQLIGDLIRTGDSVVSRRKTIEYLNDQIKKLSMESTSEAIS